MIRIVLAGVLGGIVVFVCGAIDHMVFQWGEIKGKLPNEAALVEVLRAQKMEPGLYMFPAEPTDVSQDEKEKVWIERYKQGPNGLLVLGRTGEDPMTVRELGLEAVTNIAAALIAAWILTLLATGTNYYTRWLVVLFLGILAWLSVSASYAIWYRFPWLYIRGELLCALFEWGVAGLVIAAIAKPQATSTST